MHVTADPPRGKSLLDIVVGIEAGVIGGAVMLAWYAISSPLLGQPWWLMWNLMASKLMRGDVLHSGVSMATWAGAAVQVVGAGLVGAINGILTPGGRLFGLGIAIGWYLLCWFMLWKKTSPLMLTHAPQPLVIAAYFLYGSVLGLHPRLVRGFSARSEGRVP